MDTLGVLAVVSGVVALCCFGGSIHALRRKRFFGTTVGVLFGLLLLTLGALFSTIGIATQGYRAFTREAVAATIETRPSGPQRFDAVVTYPNGASESYSISGDQLYVDAHILKWKPLGNLLGLHTSYELDRIGGRYIDLADEIDSSRTLFSLKQPKRLDMFKLRQRYALFRPLLDTEYGSATYLAVDRPDTFEVRVSTSGLLMRREGP